MAPLQNLEVTFIACHFHCRNAIDTVEVRSSSLVVPTIFSNRAPQALSPTRSQVSFTASFTIGL
jgi:hypothetical protein